MNYPLIIGIVLGAGAFVYLLTSPAASGEGLFGMHLSAQQIAGYAQTAGFSGPDLVTAVAVALAESSGNPQAHGDKSLGTGIGSFGLWQIYADAHPEFGPDFSALFDPQTNAQAAYQVYQAAGGSFRPWSTFNSGAYFQYVEQAQQGVSG
jgi:hypothetical protein